MIRQGRLVKRPDLTIFKRSAVACCDACTSLCKPVYDFTRRGYGGYGYGGYGGYGGGYSAPSAAAPKLPQELVNSLDKSQLMMLARSSPGGGNPDATRAALERLAAAS